MSTDRALVALDYLRQLTDGSVEDFGALLGELLQHESFVDSVRSAKIIGPWTWNESDRDWERCAVLGDSNNLRGWVWPVQDGARWTTWNDDGGETGAAYTPAPTLADAMRAVDEALRAEGRILIGGLPAEVLEQERPPRTFVGVDYGNGTDAPVGVVVERADAILECSERDETILPMPAVPTRGERLQNCIRCGGTGRHVWAGSRYGADARCQACAGRGVVAVQP